MLLLVLFIVTGCNKTNPETKEIKVTYESSGGAYNKAFLSEVGSKESIVIKSLNDESGTNITLFDKDQNKLRWFNKLFLKHNPTLDLYEVVYKDAMTAAVSDLDVPIYDYMIGMHNQFSDVEDQALFLDLIQTNTKLYITFSKELSTYTQGEIEMVIYRASVLESIVIAVNENKTPPTPYKEGFTFVGWTYKDEIIKTIDLTIYKQDIVLKAKWQGKSVADLEKFIKEYVPLETSENIYLPLSYSGYSIEWQSSDVDVISNSGIYKKPYQSQKVTLTALITGIETLSLSFDVETEGYKSLEGKIASSYIYRGYDKVDDRFFEILDIINTAFIIADEQGNLNGTAYLNNVSTHIMPKAKIHGNYVIMSVAPESSWSAIAESASLRGKFADNIVLMINQYGFDGVDIDWETPYESEKLRYTQLMKIVYEKVKANNPNHLVTTAITGGMWQPPRYDLVNSKQYIDYINLMTYGMTNASGQYQNALYKSTVNDNTEFKAGRTLISASIDESVKFFKNTYDISYSKIIVGLAFYGMKQIRTFDQGTNTYSAWVKAESVYYNDIANNYLSNDLYIKKYDINAGVPYILKKDGTEFISYDNPRSILEKTAYVIDQNLAGVMFWEYGTDTTKTLLEAIDQGFN